ncbi:AlwI family type II restriction endonuclease [Mammaliicoccus sciuri]|uniref:AlwI family type II restriction endonuclease n=1 Tax=Mammaliicoccus sciuri TaxID=1296 RepID=UPI003CE954BE
MKLVKSAKTFNIGGTSFRRKTLIDDYKVLLPYLKETNIEYDNWENEAQAEFYRKILNETELFTRNDSEDFAKRGRTLTSPLSKIGLTNSKRKLSTVANHWINGKTTSMDEVEQALAIDINNLVFTRQLLKLRIYDANGYDYFYPFRVAIELVMKYQNIPQNDFLTLIHLIHPSLEHHKIKDIIEDYRNVDNNSEIFSEFINRNFPEKENNDISADHLFSEQPLNREKFNLLFVNRKTSETQEVYFKFVNSLLNFKENKSFENLNELLSQISDQKLKTAFGFGKSIFEKSSFDKSKKVQDFLNENIDNPLLSENNVQIYNQFLLSKKDDQVKEYRDMTKRTFNLSGLIDFSNGLVNAFNKEILSIIFNSMNLSGKEDILNYEEGLEYTFYQDITITEILRYDKNTVLESIKRLLAVDKRSQIASVVLSQKEDKFRNFIETTFPREKIIEILLLFSKRDDNRIKTEVSEFATVSTIYEYIVAIAWYYISSEQFFITKSLNLTLDGNMRPLSHAVGGAGDIVINYENLTLMLEVTLMNSQAQKRGEWEPVLRHATNLTVDNSNKNTITLFIANELDINTINIWRAVASVPLKSSNKNEIADLVKIFPLKNDELLDMLKYNKNESKLITAIDKSYTELAGNFDLDWRNKIFIDAEI